MAVRVEVIGKKLTREFTVPILWEVSSLKGLIKGWCGIEEDRQVLREGEWVWNDKFIFMDHPKVRGRNDKELDETLLKFFLHVIPLRGDAKFTFSVKYKSSSVVEEVTMRETQTVKELKEIIVSTDTNLRYYEIDVEYLGHTMEDNCSLRDYHVCPGCQVEVLMIDD